MRQISDAASQELVWAQPAALKREFELRAGDDLVGTLRFQRGSLADAETEGEHWTFKREGFWQPRVTARHVGSGADIAVFRPHWAGGGTLEFPDGRALKLAAANFWQSEWVWAEKDQPLIRFKGRNVFVKAKGLVEVDPTARMLPDLGLLVELGWYLIVLYAEDTTAATTVATVVSVSS